MDLWIPITIAAAFVQNLRSTLQKHLKSKMGTTGASFVRFGFGMPFAWSFLIAGVLITGSALPDLNAGFIIWVLTGSLAQIAAQILLVMLFSLRNFAVGNAYSRTEPAQAAMIGFAFLGDRLTMAAIGAIAVSMSGVMLISVARSLGSIANARAALFSRPAAIGILAGFFFGVAAVAYRGASLALGGPGFFVQAAFTLAVAISFQSLVMLIWMAMREPEELTNIRRAWKPSLAAGFVGATASLGWFTAMTLQSAAIVKALAQIEMLFSFASSVFIFKERIHPLEVVGCVLISAGIIGLLVGAL